jgi:hypothetical protein
LDPANPCGFSITPSDTPNITAWLLAESLEVKNSWVTTLQAQSSAPTPSPPPASTPQQQQQQQQQPSSTDEDSYPITTVYNSANKRLDIHKTIAVAQRLSIIQIYFQQN